MEEQPTLYTNTDIFTMDREVPRVEALLVRDGRVAALGPRTLVEEQADSRTRRVDLAHRAIVPGFNDCHCHILSFGLTLEQVDLSPEAVRGLADLKRAIGQRAQTTPDGRWVLGRGYDQNSLAERRHPTRQDLDAVTGGLPTVIWHTSGHAMVCNSRALQIAGVGASTPDPAGGEIERDEHGRPTGVLFENPAMDLVDKHIPPPTVDQGTEAIVRAMQVMASEGITSASDAATGQGSTPSLELTMYRRALDSGRLAGRITLMPQIRYVAPPDADEAFEPDEFWVGNRPEWLQVGATKIFSDGAITTRTAALHDHYEDEVGNTGTLIWEPDVLAGMIRRAHVAGWQIATHAIGDRAIEIVLDCYERALAETPREDARHRIEHCMMVDRSQVERIQRLGVIPTLQPGFIGRLGDAYIAALGPRRAAQLNPMEIFELFGIPVAFSSDRPVIPGSPLRGITSAMQRRSPSGAPLGPEHSISALQAIRYYTSGSAFATRTEGDRGTLRRGSRADFTVLSRSPAGISPEDVGDIRVTMTVVGGAVTYEA